MTSKLVVNTIEADTGISSVSFASSISMSSTSKFHFSNAGIDIGADTNINRPAAGVLGFNINSAEKFRIDSSGHIKAVGVCTATHFYGDGSNLTGISGVSVANQADNRLITATGTTDALNAESSITYDGTKVLNITSSAGGFFQGTDSDGGIGLLEMGNGDVAIQADTGNSINNSKIHFFLDGSEKARITSDGKMGLGTNSPQRLLHLSSNNTVFALTDTAASTDQKTKYILSDAGAFAFGKLSDDYGTATEQFRIGNSGNIGVGEQSPSAALDVKGSGVPIVINSSNSNTYKIQLENAGSTLGYIGAVTDSIVFSNSSAAEQARFTDSGLKLPSGRGIDFSATSDASGMSSELLDDYEEGTFSPIPDAGGGVTFTYAHNTGFYTKIGNTVTFQIYLMF